MYRLKRFVIINCYGRFNMKLHGSQSKPEFSIYIEQAGETQSVKS